MLLSYHNSQTSFTNVLQKPSKRYLKYKLKMADNIPQIDTTHGGGPFGGSSVVSSQAA